MARESSYRRVLATLRERILTGELAPGDRMPSIAEIAATYAVTLTTAGAAIRALQAEGHVVSRHGSGTIVREYATIRRSSPARLANAHWGGGTDIQVHDTGPRPNTVDIEVGEMPAPVWVATLLAQEAGSPVVFRSRRFIVDDRYVQLATSYLPPHLARGTAIMHTNTGPGGSYARLAEAGHVPVRFVEELRARMPYPDETNRLGLPDGTPVIEITRVAYEESGNAVEVNRMILDATAYVLDYAFPAESSG